MFARESADGRISTTLIYSRNLRSPIAPESKRQKLLPSVLGSLPQTAQSQSFLCHPSGNVTEISE